VPPWISNHHSEPDDDWFTIDLKILGRKSRFFMTYDECMPEHVPEHWRAEDLYTYVVTVIWYGPEGKRSSDQKPFKITTWYVSSTSWPSQPTFAEIFRIFLAVLRSDGMSFVAWAEDIDGCSVSKRELFSHLRYMESRQLASSVRAFLGNNDEVIAELERLDDDDLIAAIESGSDEPEDPDSSA